MTTIRTLSKQTTTKLAEVFRRTLTPLPAQGGQGTAGGAPGIWYWGKLTSDLDAPANGMSSPTFATFDVWVPDGLTDPPGVTFIRSADVTQQGVKVWNRSQGLSAANGTIIQAEFAWGEWILKWIDC